MKKMRHFLYFSKKSVEKEIVRKIVNMKFLK